MNYPPPSSAPSDPSPAAATLRMMIRYKAWANAVTFHSVMAMPEPEALRERPTRFGSIARTLNHVYVVDDIFRHHLQGRNHGYLSRSSDHTPSVPDLWEAVQEMDHWYIHLVDAWSQADLAEPVAFTFVGGGDGIMTREHIILHLVNHATYHRGFVGDMMYQASITPPANDLTVFLRDHHRIER